MELKDAILSTLAEIDEITKVHTPQKIEETITTLEEPSRTNPSKDTIENVVDDLQILSTYENNDEERFLENIRERMLVLFEGFQSPNNVQIESKVDLTLNFLEYLLGTIDERLDNIEKRK